MILKRCVLRGEGWDARTETTPGKWMLRSGEKEGLRTGTDIVSLTFEFGDGFGRAAMIVVRPRRVSGRRVT